MGQKSPKYVALIPARGGSKGIPGKNIKLMCGQPLLYWACKAANESHSVHAVYVSTENVEIAKVVRSLKLNKLHLFQRSPETATDSASTENCMLEFAERMRFTNVILLQATSPLLSKQDIDRAVATFENNNLDSVISVVRQKRFIWEERRVGVITPQNYNPRQRPKRQNQVGFLVENGAIYITSRKTLLEEGCRVGKRVGYIEMPMDTYFEVDEPEDWTIVETLLERRLVPCEAQIAKL